MPAGHVPARAEKFGVRFIGSAAIASARLPEKAGDPLKNLTLRDGWLIDPRIPASGELPADYAMPAPYLEYKGHRDKALWFPNEKLARAQFELGRDEPRKEMELFTFLDPTKQPSVSRMARWHLCPIPRLCCMTTGCSR